MLPSHSWDISPAQAIDLQNQLRSKIILVDQLAEVHTIAGVDVGFEDDGRTARAAVAVLRYPALELYETSLCRSPVNFPYIPGLLSFRETPILLEALGTLSASPDLLMCDGHGFAHPRRLGIASHIGLLSGIPSIGVAKSRLIGSFDLPAQEKSAATPLMDREEMIGTVLRTRENVKPIYVSIGHKVSLETAVHWVLQCTTRFRLPEPVRAAHHLASG